MAEVDPNTLVLNQILSELQKLNTFEAQTKRDADNLLKVQQANAQTPMSPNLMRAAGPGAQLPGALSANASTPDVLSQDEQQQMARQTANRNQNRQLHGNDPEAEEAVAWSLLSEAGVGGPYGRLRQAQYSVGRNIGAVSNFFGGGSAPGGPLARAQDTLDVQAANAYARGGMVGNAQGAILSGMSSGLTPVRAAGSAVGDLANFAENHELATTLGVLAVTTGADKARDYYEMGANLGYGTGQYGAVLGMGRGWRNFPTTNEGRLIAQSIRQLQGFQSVIGGPGAAGARALQGLTHEDAKALVGQLFEQGYSAEPTGAGYFAGGNLPTIARGLAPAVQAMGQQGAQIAGSWTQSLRSANDSLSDLTQMLEQMPAAARSSQLGLEGVNQALQNVAQTVSSMGGTQSEGLRIGQQFLQQYPGLNPQDMSGLLQSPIFQAFGLARGVLPSGLSTLPGGQLNALTQQSVRMVMGALQGLAPAQQYTTLPDGTRVPLNNPQAAVAQQAASQFFPGVNPQDLLRIMNQSPQRMAATSRLQDLLGQTTLGRATGLEYLTGGGHPEMWDRLGAGQQRAATEYWNQNIAPMLSQVLDPAKIRALNQTGNISRRAELLNQDLYGAKGQAANQPGNAATVQVQIGLQGKAAQVLTATATAKGQAKKVQNAGGLTMNVPLNSPLGQNPVYGGFGIGNNNFLGPGNNILGHGDPNFLTAGP